MIEWAGTTTRTVTQLTPRTPPAWRRTSGGAVMAEHENGEQVAELVQRWVDLVWGEGPEETLGDVKLDYREEDVAAIRALRAAFPDVQATLSQHLATMTL